MINTKNLLNGYNIYSSIYRDISHETLCNYKNTIILRSSVIRVHFIYDTHTLFCNYQKGHVLPISINNLPLS